MLLIDLSNQGKVISRKQNELGDDTIAKVLDQISRWRIGEELEKVNFLINVDHASVEERKFTLAPGQYLEIEVERVEITEESFMEKISKLIYDFERLADEEQRLTKQIISNMKSLKYEQADNDES